MKRLYEALKKNIILVTGHFGSGKTNFSCNLALELKKAYETVYLIDYDTVNPYFRAADFSDEAKSAGIKLIAPGFANTNVDIPSLPPEIRTALLESENGAKVIFDVGGDMLGAAALGIFGREIKKDGYDLLYVNNACRPLTQTPLQAYEIMKEIENRCGLKSTYIVNNTNLGEETDAETVNASISYTDELSALSALPVLCTSVMTDGDIYEKYPVFRMRNITRNIIGGK